jgi:hypothetical protein
MQCAALHHRFLILCNSTALEALAPPPQIVATAVVRPFTCLQFHRRPQSCVDRSREFAICLTLPYAIFDPFLFLFASEVRPPLLPISVRTIIESIRGL